MDTVIERCAGLDVHKDTVMACVRVQRPAATADRSFSVSAPLCSTYNARALIIKGHLPDS